MLPSVLVTVPPFWTMSVPELGPRNPPTTSWSLIFQAEPGSVTVIVPVAPGLLPRKPPDGPVSTCPPPAIVTCPVPELPMTSPTLFVQVAPAPLTVTVPRALVLQPAQPPTWPSPLLTVPPLPMLSTPVLLRPM